MLPKPLAIVTIGLGVLLTATLAAAQAAAPTQQSGSSQESGWKTVIYPIHGWMPIFGADVTLPEQNPPGGGGPSRPAAKTSGNFDGAALAGFRVERARVSIESEFLWAGMSGSVEAPRFNLSLDTVTFRVKAGFKVAPAFYIDGGVRRLGIKMKASILDFPPVTWKPAIWEPVVGMTFRPELTRNLRLFTQADVGFSGDNSSRSSVVTGMIEWKPFAHFSVGGGWGWMYLKAEGAILNKDDIRFSQTLNGPIITIGIPF